MSELIEKIFEWVASDDAIWFFFGWEAALFITEPNWVSGLFCAFIIFLLFYKPDPE